MAFLGHSAQQKTGKMPTFEIKKRVYYVGRLRIVIRLICRADCYIFQIGVAGISSNLATAIRTVVILVLVWGIVLAKGEQRELGVVSKHSLFFLIISGIATGLSWLFYFKALQIGEVSKVAPVDKLSVALVIVLSALFLGEPMTTKTWLGAGLIVAGTLVLTWK